MEVCAEAIIRNPKHVGLFGHRSALGSLLRSLDSERGNFRDFFLDSERGNFRLFGLIYQLYFRKFELFAARLLKKREIPLSQLCNICTYSRVLKPNKALYYPKP